MFVKPADSNTGLLHHIGDTDAFNAEFAKPLGRDVHDPSVRRRLVTLRIAHLSSPSFPGPHGSLHTKELQEYCRTLHDMDASCLGWGARQSQHQRLISIDAAQMHEDDKRFQQLSGKCLQLLDYGRNPNNVRTDRPVIGAREAMRNSPPEQRKAIVLGAMVLAVGARFPP